MEHASLRVNGQEWDAPTVPGSYVTVDRAWQKDDEVQLDLAMPPRMVQGNPRIEAIRGRVAIRRGPVVYCLEQAGQEQSADITEVEIDPSSPIQDTWQGDLLGGVTTLALAGFAIDNSRWHGNLYMSVASSDEVARIADPADCGALLCMGQSRTKRNARVGPDCRGTLR